MEQVIIIDRNDSGLIIDQMNEAYAHLEMIFDDSDNPVTMSFKKAISDLKNLLG